MLAGGQSRRLGGIPKGLETIGPTRIIDRVERALHPVTPEIWLAANDPDASTWLRGVPVLEDLNAGRGGLAGVQAALARGRDVIVVAWDMPFVTTRLLRALHATAVERRADAVLPSSDSPHGFEPFCAFYSARLAKPLTAFLESGGGAAHEFIDSVDRLQVLPDDVVRELGDPARLFFSVNTPDELARARAMAQLPE